ncbi:hypothetical protein SUGI_1035910 [Cryptomeria japonica]|uniref:probable methyltransferase At1g29790 n=1 Tax=Cryptomeria japonica TaxID=3369 RepID=UPI002414B76D|nr:probable methyltransferase At1g29790 [Cryptomeria japonica]GLJ49102.1 hypothetical protein SUGI_1035910 [Cryptomeria japonica]
MSSDGNSKWKAGDSSKLHIILLILCTNLTSIFLFSGPFHWIPLQYLHPDNDSTHSQNLSSNRAMQGNEELIASLNQTRRELQSSKELSEELKAQIAQLTQFLRSSVQHPNSNDPDDPWLKWGGGSLPAELREFISPKKLPLGNSPNIGSDTIYPSVGQACALFKDDLNQYMDYKPGELCPKDEVLAQKLLLWGCEPLPRRRCIPHNSPNYQEPFPFTDCMWTTPPNSSVVWTAYTCKDCACLIDRKNHPGFDDCKDCFDLQFREKTRWLRPGGSIDYSIDEVLALKKGTIRIGLDIGGGTATFAVRMRERNVTIVTTSMNFNGPFNNFIASRGVVPLYITITQRLPFFDNTLEAC